MAYWGTFVFGSDVTPTPFCPCCGRANYTAPYSGAPPRVSHQDTYAEQATPAPAPFLDVTGADDWEDIPSEAPTHHMSEEEEDVRFQIATGQAEPVALDNILKLVKANTADIKIEVP
jgi:hypothetical protein